MVSDFLRIAALDLFFDGYVRQPNVANVALDSGNAHSFSTIQNKKKRRWDDESPPCVPSRSNSSSYYLASRKSSIQEVPTGDEL